MDKEECQPRWRYKLKALSAPMLQVSTGQLCKELDIVAGMLYTFGRSRTRCNIVFDDRRVSRKHCQLYLDPYTTKLFLRNGIDSSDLAFMSPAGNGISVAASTNLPSYLPTAPSLNGVFVNGELLAPGGHEVLSHGAVVSLVACTRNDQVQDVNFGPAIGFRITVGDAAQTLVNGLASSQVFQRTLKLQEQLGSGLRQGPEKVVFPAEGTFCAQKRRKTLESLSCSKNFPDSTCMYPQQIQCGKLTQSVPEAVEGSLAKLRSDHEILRLMQNPPISQKTALTDAVADHTRTSSLHSVGNSGNGDIFLEDGLPSSSKWARSAVKRNLSGAKASYGISLHELVNQEDDSAIRDAVVVQEDGDRARRLCGSGLEQSRDVECTLRSGLLSSCRISPSTCSTHEEASLRDPQDKRLHSEERPSFEGQGKTEAYLIPMLQNVTASNTSQGSGPQFSKARPWSHPPWPPAVFLNKLQGIDETMGCNTISLRELLEPLDDVVAIFAATFTGDIKWFLSANNIPTELPVTIACHDDVRCWSLSKDDRLASPLPDWPKVTLVYPPFPEICAVGTDQQGHRRGIGCHHPKFFLLRRKRSMRVVITSANLTAAQWSKVTNNIWLQDFPRLHKRSYAALFHHQSVLPNDRNTHGDFAAQLAAFISSLLVDVPAQIHWVVDLADFDFSDAEATLIASIPGLHGCPYEPVTLCKMEFPDLKQTVTVEQALGVVDTFIVGIAHRFGPETDLKGARLEKLASVIHRQKEVESGLIRVTLKRMLNITADSNAVGVFIPDECDASSSVMQLQKDETLKATHRSMLVGSAAHMQIGFLSRDTAKWVAHLCDVGACIFVGYVSPKDVITVAYGLISGCAQLMLHVYKSAQFSQHLDECYTSEHETAICCLLRTLKRPLGLWRLHQVLSKYEWPSSDETDFVYASSSIGTSLDVHFFAAFAAAAGRKSTSLVDLDSVDSDPEWGSWTVEHEAKEPSVGIIFPTIERAKRARGGIESHRGLHHFHESTWIRLKSTGLFLDAVPFPSNREGVPMHVKVARRRFENESEVSYGWVYYGSHNFSPAAWGRPRFKRVKGCKTSGFANIQVLGCALLVSNYELGAIFAVPPPEVGSELPRIGRADFFLVKQPSIKSLDQLQLPFVSPAQKYGATDKPITGKEIREALRQSKLLEGDDWTSDRASSSK